MFGTVRYDRHVRMGKYSENVARMILIFIKLSEIGHAELHVRTLIQISSLPFTVLWMTDIAKIFLYKFHHTNSSLVKIGKYTVNKKYLKTRHFKNTTISCV